MNAKEIGTIEALLSSIKTKVDGSCVVSFEINPDNVQTVNKLMQQFLINKKLFTIAIVQCED